MLFLFNVLNTVQMNLNMLIGKHIHVQLYLVFGIVICMAYTEIHALKSKASYLTIADGLSSPNVKSIFQNCYGLIWYATINGFHRYDGTTFKTCKTIPGDPCSLGSNDIWSIVEDNVHDLCLATAVGASRFNRQFKTFTNYDLVEIFYLPPYINDVFNLYIDSQNNLCAANRSVELVQYDKEAGTWNRTKYYIPNLSEQEISVNNVMFAIIKDSDGELWMGSHPYGLLYRAIGEGEFSPSPMDPSVKIDFETATHSITALYINRANHIF